MTAKLKDVRITLNTGGLVRFVWKTGQCYLVRSDGFVQNLDGRTYHAFCDKHQNETVRVDTGDTERGDLIIEWRLQCTGDK